MNLFKHKVLRRFIYIYISIIYIAVNVNKIKIKKKIKNPVKVHFDKGEKMLNHISKDYKINVF